jgi:hypothetical protein
VFFDWEIQDNLGSRDGLDASEMRREP